MKNIDRIAMDVNIDSGEVVFIVAEDTGNGTSSSRLSELAELDRQTVRKFIAENIKTIEWFGSTEKWDRFIIKPMIKEGDC